MGQFGHLVCNCLKAFTGQHSPYGSDIGSGPLCPLKRLIFSSAVSRGLMNKNVFKFRIENNVNLFESGNAKDSLHTIFAGQIFAGCIP